MNVTNLHTSSERLCFVINHFWHKQTHAAKALKMSQPYISQVLAGTRGVSKKILQNIASARPQVNIDWIISGEGDWLKSVIGERYRIGDVAEDLVEDVEVEYEVDPLGGLRKALLRIEGRLDEIERRLGDLEGRLDDIVTKPD